MTATPSKTGTKPTTEKVAKFFLYGDNNIPAYRDAGGFVLVMPDGSEKPVTDLWKWMHEATAVSEEEFNARKAERAVR
jgi:hypothetical protein